MAEKKAAKPAGEKVIYLRLPNKLIEAIDARAAAERRSRTQTLEIVLEHEFLQHGDGA